MRQTCLSRVVSWLSALCLHCWAVPQQCEEALAVPTKGTAGPSMGSLALSKAPVASEPSSVLTVPYLRGHLRWLRGEAAYMKATAMPVTSTLPPQPRPLLPPATEHFVGGSGSWSLDVIRSCLHILLRRAQGKGAAGSSTGDLLRWALC